QYARRRGIWQATMVCNLSTGTNVAEIPPTQAKTGLQKGTGFGAAAVPASYWHGGSFLLAFPASYKTFSLSYRLLKNARFSHSMSPLGPQCQMDCPCNQSIEILTEKWEYDTLRQNSSILLEQPKDGVLPKERTNELELME